MQTHEHFFDLADPYKQYNTIGTHMHTACTCHSTRVNSKIMRDLVQSEMACNVSVQDSPVPQLNHEYCNPAIQS